MKNKVYNSVDNCLIKMYNRTNIRKGEIDENTRCIRNKNEN